MSKIVVEHLASEAVNPITSYDQTKWNLGTLIKQRTDFKPNFIGPIQPALARPFETSAAIPSFYPNAISWSSNIDWVFLADSATAANTRRVQLYTFNRSNSSLGWAGFITLTYPTASAHTIKSLRASYEQYNTGTISGSSTTLIGTSTLWVTNRMCVGCRIGFGSTGATNITTWYSIGAIGGEGAMTISPALPTTLPAGTTYVIEDLRIITVTRNATSTNGGVYVTKGISYNLFTPAGSTIPAAVATDNISAVYWLADASTETNVTASGSAYEAKTGWTGQNLYVLECPANSQVIIYKYNIRKALTLASGKDTTTLILKTGTGTITNEANSGTEIGDIITLTSAGPQSGVKSLYFTNPTRIYCAPLSAITSTSTTFIKSQMYEQPTGNDATHLTFNKTLAMNQIAVSNSLNKLIVMSSGANGLRNYITNYNITSGATDNIFLVDTKQIDQSAVDMTTVPHPSILNQQQTVSELNGLLYLTGIGNTVTTNFLHVVPIGADWQYASATNQRLISPVFSTPNANKFSSFYVLSKNYDGSLYNGKTLDAYRTYYRTSGITSNNGTWTLASDGNYLTGVTTATTIQFMVEFKTISDYCIPNKIYGIGVVYNNISTDSHYEPNANFSSVTGKTFAWRFIQKFGNTVPTLRVRLYIIGGGLAVDDNTATPSGTWQKSINGTSWISYDTNDLTNNTTYIKYINTGLADNNTIKALLTLY